MTYIPAQTQKLIDLAKSQVGYHEGRKGGVWTNVQKYSEQVPGLAWSDGQAWCNTFMSWLDWKLGMGVFPHTASTDAAYGAFKKAGRLSRYPGIGAQMFIGTGTNPNHTGLVIDYDATSIWTVEGNSNNNGSREGDGVYLQKRARNSPRIIGYGMPRLVGGINTEDPVYAGQLPKPPKAKSPTRVELAKTVLTKPGPFLREAENLLGAASRAATPGGPRQRDISEALVDVHSARVALAAARAKVKEIGR